MIDYRTHLAALEQLKQSLGQASDPDTADLRDRHLDEIAQAPGMALLGCLVDHLVAHAVADGVELSLLERASTLWKQGTDIFSALGEFRTRLEIGLSNPSDAAAQLLNDATSQLQSLAVQVQAQLTSIENLRADVVTFAHLPPHPRQEDRPIEEWDWANIFLARRTDAYVRSTRRLATSAATGAFAFGVLSGYGANVAGSAYLGEVVGGPRRSHRERDRVARNTMGSWFATHNPNVPALSELAQTIRNELGPELSGAADDFIRSTLTETYGEDRLPATPSLNVGYQRLIRHLELLDGLVVPPVPAPPAEPFLTRLFGDPANSYVPTMPPTEGLTEAGASGGSGAAGGIVPQNQGTDDGPTHAEDPPSTEVKCGAFWEAIGSALLFLLGGWLACVIRWQDGDRCELWDNITQNWEEAFPDGGYVAVESGSAALSGADLTNLANADEAVQLIGDLFSLQSQMWEGFNKATDFLALYGLVYPDGLLDRWRYGQFVATPATAPASWPRRSGGLPRFDKYPTTAVEQPAMAALEYPVGSNPDRALVAANAVSTQIWVQMATGVLDAPNCDLDADRGYRHPCWAAQGSINDQPIDVRMLGYHDV